MWTILAQSTDGSFWLPPKVSTFAAEVDPLWNFLIILSTICFIGIGGTMFAVAIIYRQKDKDKVAHGHTHNTALEITWSVIPLIIVLGIFVWGFRGYLNMATPPDDAMEVLVKAKKWDWQFYYPNGAQTNMLHVPVDRPVKLVLDSDDVIHSFYVPQFRIKKDAVPGRYNKTWFVVRSQDNPKIADGAPGEYDLYCAEYCGTNHSTMLSKVYVYTAADWPAKYEEISRPYDDEKTPAENGLKVYQIRGCAQCHSLDGTRGTGPSFENLFGYEQELKSGEKPVADEAFIRQAIMYPNSQGIKGYQPQMPNVNLKPEEIDYIIAFLKSKSDRGGSDEAAAPAGETGAETPAQTPAETGEAQP